MLVEAGCTAAQATAITGHDSIQVFEGYIRERVRVKLADDAMTKLIEASEANKKVPPEIAVLASGTKLASNTLIGKVRYGQWLPELDSNQ